MLQQNTCPTKVTVAGTLGLQLFSSKPQHETYPQTCGCDSAVGLPRLEASALAASMGLALLAA